MNGKARCRRLARAAVLILPLAAASAADTKVVLTRGSDKTYEVAGLFSVNASTTVVWGVLTDYDHIPAFVASMRASRILETHPDGSLLVEQDAVGRAFSLVKTMHVLLEVRRSSDTLRFADTGREDFLSYDGDWEVRSAAGGASVTYHLRARPKFFAPSFLMSRAMKRGARALLDQVRAEIVRRTLHP